MIGSESKLDQDERDEILRDESAIREAERAWCPECHCTGGHAVGCPGGDEEYTEAD